MKVRELGSAYENLWARLGLWNFQARLGLWKFAS